jgi:NADH-quinone oxidoreductase subunit N
MYAMVCANDFLVMFLGIELASLTLYLLAAIKTNSNYSSEAAMKYFILGAVASGFIGFGISIIYTSTGTINFTNIKLLFMDLGPSDIDVLNEVDYYQMGYNRTVTGLILVLIGILCKLAAAPFHM